MQLRFGNLFFKQGLPKAQGMKQLLHPDRRRNPHMLLHLPEKLFCCRQVPRAEGS